MAAIMIQGCGSDVGKSVLVAGLCRLFANRGLIVRPFKSQNMSNNAAVTADGGEIGRAQALQAVACRVTPTVHMNPVLLKPETDVGAQLIVRGKRAGVLKARAHVEDKRALLRVAVESYRELARDADLVVVEGAGSPAETNLRANDIANMGFAEAVDVSVVLVGDIDRGHVIASLVGAHAVLSVEDRARIRGFIINKFRGDQTLFAEGTQTVVSHTGWPALGIVPWLHAANRLPSEDAVRLEATRAPDATTSKRIKIVVPCFSRIANFDDFDPLRAEPDVELAFVPPGQPLPADAALVVLPGTKATIAEMQFFRSQGWDIDLLAHLRRGGRVLGICGGYQMLGQFIYDPDGIEGKPGSMPGLGLLDIETTMTSDKALRSMSGTTSEGARFKGYEIHVGATKGPATRRPMLRFDDGREDGAMSPDGRIAGCYVHGLFNEPQVRRELLATFGATSNLLNHAHEVDAALDEIADILSRCLDIRALENIAGLPPI
jgi:adenosylcobyric acid synthase